MKLVSIFFSISMLSMNVFAVETMSTLTTKNQSTSLVTTSVKDHNVLATNFVNLAKGNANIYFDVGGVSEFVSPSFSYRSSSEVEPRKELNNTKLTVDRSLATVGASFIALRQSTKSLLVNPYLFFGTEKDALGSNASNGLGARILGQVELNNRAALQAGVDMNNMESDFRGEIYIGLGLGI